MANGTSDISGHILQAGSAKPLAGMVLTTSDNDVSVSDAKGAFFLSAASGDTLSLSDRFGTMVARQTLEPGRSKDLEFVIEPALIQRHLAEPMQWDPAAGSILGRETEEVLVWAARKVGFAVKKAREALPPLSRFADLLSDATLASEGDSVALARIDEAMAALDRVTPALQTLESFDPGRIWREAGQFLAHLDSSHETALPLDAIARVLAAACLAARRNPKKARRYLALAEYHLIAAEEAARLRPAAERALYGNAADLGHWTTLWQLYAKRRHGPQLPPVEPDWRGIGVDTTIITVGPGTARPFVGLYPRRACPGETVTLTGAGFGSEPGYVRFARRGGGRVIDVSAATWTSRSVSAVVPPDAGAGTLSLVREMPVVMYGRIIYTTYEVATSWLELEIGAEVLVLSVNGNAVDPVAAPGTTAEIQWRCAGTDTTRLRVLSGGVERLNQVVDRAGSYMLAVPDFAEPSQLEIEINGTGICAPTSVRRTLTLFVEQPYNLIIDGVEITQAIQYFRSDRHLTDPADRGPDNSIPIIPFKATMLRVYLRSGLDPARGMGALPNVWGRLRLTRFLPRVTELGELRPTNTAPVTAFAGPPYATERGNLMNTLNFIISGSEVYGTLSAQIEVSTTAVHSGNGRAAQTVSFACAQWRTLQLAGLFIRYSGPGPAGGAITLVPPTLPDLQRSTGWLLETYPVSQVVYRNGGSFTFTRPLNDPPVSPGGCSANWNALLAQVISAANADGNRPGWAYFGLMPSGIPIGLVIGCGGSGVGVGGVGPNNVTLAHEVGHAFGVAHAPCGNVGTPNAVYPQYEPYDPPIAGPVFASASIGEYGVQLSTQTLFSPASTKDFMSYCGPNWISLHMTTRLLSGSLLAAGDLPPRLSAAAGSGRAMESLILIVGMLRAAEEENAAPQVTVYSVARLETRKPQRGAALPGFLAELVDAAGAVLSSGSMDDIRSEFCCAGGTAPVSSGDRVFQATLPNPALGAALRIRRGKDVLWSAQAPVTPSSIRLAHVGVKDVDTVESAWAADSTIMPDKLEVWVQWRQVAEGEWSSLQVNLKGSEAMLDVSGLSRAQPVVFRFLLNDGFATAVADSDAVQLPLRPPLAAIVQPQSETMRLGQMIKLQADGVSFTGKALAAEAFRWALDGQVVASTREAWIEAPQPGKHELTLTATDDFGSGESHLSFVVEEQP